MLECFHQKRISVTHRSVIAGFSCSYKFSKSLLRPYVSFSLGIDVQLRWITLFCRIWNSGQVLMVPLWRWIGLRLRSTHQVHLTIGLWQLSNYCDAKLLWKILDLVGVARTIFTRISNKLIYWVIYWLTSEGTANLRNHRKYIHIFCFKKPLFCL